MAYALPTELSGNLPVVLVHLLSTGGEMTSIPLMLTTTGMEIGTQVVIIE